MREAIKWSIYIGIAMLSFSCEKSEIPLDYQAPQVSMEEFSEQVVMGSDYRYRLYYDLETDSIVAFHEKKDWDLAFSSEGPDRLRLNTSKFMSVYRTNSLDISTLTAFQGNGPLYDTSDGSEDGTAIGDIELGRVFIVDRGYDAVGNSQGFLRFCVSAINASSYTIRYGNLGQSTYTEMEVPRDPAVNQVMFSFTTGLQFLEPPKEAWDLVFTHYTYYFVAEELQYLVSGALLNPYQTSSTRVNDVSFEAMDTESSAAYPLVFAADVIGYDWKIFDLDNGTYTVLDNLYLIRTSEGHLFKLNFTGFYDGLGNQGSPTFRAQELN